MKRGHVGAHLRPCFLHKLGHAGPALAPRKRFPGWVILSPAGVCLLETTMGCRRARQDFHCSLPVAKQKLFFPSKKGQIILHSL